jgi:hypothetical protein
MVRKDVTEKPEGKLLTGFQDRLRRRERQKRIEKNKKEKQLAHEATS